MNENCFGLYRMLGRSFNRKEKEHLQGEPRFCNALATMETVADYERLVELGGQLLAARGYAPAILVHHPRASAWLASENG